MVHACLWDGVLAPVAVKGECVRLVGGVGTRGREETKPLTRVVRSLPHKAHAAQYPPGPCVSPGSGMHDWLTLPDRERLGRVCAVVLRVYVFMCVGMCEKSEGEGEGPVKYMFSGPVPEVSSWSVVQPGAQGGTHLPALEDSKKGLFCKWQHTCKRRKTGTGTWQCGTCASKPH